MSSEKLNVSVVLLTKNEEHNIDACLGSCSFAKEIIVVDDESTDGTVAKAKAFGAKVFTRALAGNWGEQQTFAISKASCEWVFLIDADERVSPLLTQNLAKTLEQNPQKAFWIQRENHYNSGRKAHGILRPDWVMRLLPREGARVEGQVHPTICSPFPQEKLSGHLIHFPYRNWEAYFRKFEKYTTLSAEKYESQGKHCGFVNGIIIKPLWAFLKVYFFNLGFLDGKIGWTLSVYHYFYTMTKYVKLYSRRHPDQSL